MLRKVAEDYLESIKEIQFFLPFSSLLLLKGYYDVHIIHGSTEFGKDVIAKKDENKSSAQYVFQLKAGDINLAKYRDEIQPQLLEAVINNLSHPNFDANIPKKVFFVTTGNIKPPATIAFQEFNNFIAAKYGMTPIFSIERLDLVEDFVKYGLEPFFNLQNDPTIVGDFFGIYSKIKNGRALDSFAIEAYTKRWLKTECVNHINRLQVFLEAYLFSTLLYNSKQYYQAILFIAALARYLSKNNLYFLHYQTLIEYLSLIATSLIEDMQVIYRDEQTLANITSGNGFLSIFNYPKTSLHVLEILALTNLLLDEKNTCLNAMIAEVVKKERGSERPLSDNYAISIALIGLSLIKSSEKQLLKKLINNVTIWLCDRYDNMGLAPLGASENEEYEQLLSEYLDGLNCKKTNSSFTASVLLDLSYFADDPTFYESVANELRATSIITERFHILNDSEICEYDGIRNSFDPEFSKKYTAIYSEGIAIEAESNKISVRSPVLFFLMFLLRDRLFPTFIRELL